MSSGDDAIAAPAEFVHRLRVTDLPSEVVARAKLLVLDTLGVMVAGAAEERAIKTAAMLRSRGSSGKSTFAVEGAAGDAADAALVNALCACSHVLDEGHKYARGHVGTYVLPSILAVAEERQASGAEFLAALVAGYEVAARLGMACRVRESMHPSGTWGTIGAAAAVARLMGFPVAGIVEAMNVAAPLTLATSWKAAVDGATVRDLYSGAGAANAVWAPRWVEAGFTGAPGDVANVFGRVSSERFDASASSDGLGTRWEIMRSYFKVHACCRNFQSGIDVALDLRREYGFKPDDIDAVRVETFAVPVRDNMSAEPRNVLAAKESLPVSLALTLIHGTCDQSVFTDTNVYADATRRIASKVTAACDPGLDALFPDQRPTRLAVALKDGRTVEGYAGYALGDPSRPVPDGDLVAKYRAQTDRLDDAEGLLRDVQRLEALPLVGTMVARLSRARLREHRLAS